MKQELHTVAIDLAKKVFYLVGTVTTGKIGYLVNSIFMGRGAPTGHDSSVANSSVSALCGECSSVRVSLTQPRRRTVQPR